MYWLNTYLASEFKFSARFGCFVFCFCSVVILLLNCKSQTHPKWSDMATLSRNDISLTFTVVHSCVKTQSMVKHFNVYTYTLVFAHDRTVARCMSNAVLPDWRPAGEWLVSLQVGALKGVEVLTHWHPLCGTENRSNGRLATRPWHSRHLTTLSLSRLTFFFKTRLMKKLLPWL